MDTIHYNTIFKAEIKDVNGQKIVMLSGTLLNDKINSNLWKVSIDELSSLAAQFKGHPIKLQHADSDWEIIGNGVSAEVEGNSITYIAKITDSRALDKFLTKTWTADNMGISPSVEPTQIFCTICGEEINGEECPHFVGNEYKGKICAIETKGNKLIESSLTSRPAYEDVGAGTINDANLEILTASIKKITKTEEKIMAEEKTVKELKAEIETVKEELATANDSVEKVTSDMVDKDAKIVELEKKVEETTPSNDGGEGGENENGGSSKQEAEIKTLKKSLEASQKEVSGYKKEIRTAEIKKLVSDEKLVASILDKDMTDVEFKAEIVKIEQIIKLSASTDDDTTNDTGGSAPPEGGDTNEGKTLVEQEFGLSAEEMAKKLIVN